MGTTRATVKGDAGVTVAEVIIALFVMAVGLLALIATMPLSTSLIGTANMKTTATFLAQQRMEEIKNATWSFTQPPDELGGAGSPGTAPVGEWPDEAAIGLYPQFQRQVRIKDCSVAPICVAGVNPPALLNALRRVTVTVSFVPMTGVGTFSTATLESVQLVTFIAQRP